MKFIVVIILTALLGFAGSLFFPWWIIAVTSFAVAALIPQKAWLAFTSGFAALFLLWGIQAASMDIANHHILSAKVAKLLPLGGSYIALLFLSAFVGGLVAGSAALTGNLARKMI